MAVKVPGPASKRQRASSGRKTASGDGDTKQLGALIAGLAQETMLWQSFLRAHRIVVEQLSNQMLHDHDLPLEWFDILIHLADVPSGALRQRVLRDRLLLSESGVSRMLLRMETAGLITRSPADDDRRGMAITLTAQGRSAVVAATESHLELVSALFTDRLTPTDRDALMRVLRKLSDPEPNTATSKGK